MIIHITITLRLKSDFIIAQSDVIFNIFVTIIKNNMLICTSLFFIIKFGGGMSFRTTFKV